MENRRQEEGSPMLQGRRRPFVETEQLPKHLQEWL